MGSSLDHDSFLSANSMTLDENWEKRAHIEGRQATGARPGNLGAPTSPQAVTASTSMRRRTFETCFASQRPRGVVTPRPFRAAAIARSVFAPAAWASRTKGATVSAKVSAPALWLAFATARAPSRRGLPRIWPRAFAAARAAFVAGRDHCALFLGQGGE